MPLLVVNELLLIQVTRLTNKKFIIKKRAYSNRLKNCNKLLAERRQHPEYIKRKVFLAFRYFNIRILQGIINLMGLSCVFVASVRGSHVPQRFVAERYSLKSTWQQKLEKLINNRCLIGQIYL